MFTKEDKPLTIPELLVSYDKKLLKEYHLWYNEMMCAYNLALGPNGKLNFDPDNKYIIAMAKRAIKYQGGSVKLVKNGLDTQAIRATMENEEVVEIGTLNWFNFNESVTQELKIEIHNMCLSIAFATIMVLYKHGYKTFDKAAITVAKFTDEIIDQTGLLHFLKEGELTGEEALKFRELLMSWLVTICARLGVLLMSRLKEFSPKAYPLYLLPGVHAKMPCLTLYFTSENYVKDTKKEKI